MTGTPDTVTAVARYYLTICSFNGNEFGIMIKSPCSFVQYIRNESIYSYTNTKFLILLHTARMQSLNMAKFSNNDVEKSLLCDILF